MANLKEMLLKRREEMKRKMEEKINKESPSSSSGADVKWKPQVDPGEYKVRFLPALDDSMDPFKKIHFHYLPNSLKEGGSKVAGAPDYSVMCPKRNFGKACPICEFASNLFSSVKDAREPGSEEYEQRELAKNLFASERHYSLVMVRGEEDKGPRWYPYGKTIYNKLLETWYDDENFGDFTEPFPLDEDFRGRDWKVTCKKQSGKPWPDTDISILPATKWLFKPEKKSEKAQMEAIEKVDEYMKKAPPLGELFEIQQPGDVTPMAAQKWLDAVIACVEGDPEAGASEESFGGAKESEKDVAVDVKSKLDDLMDEDMED